MSLPPPTTEDACQPLLAERVSSYRSDSIRSKDSEAVNNVKTSSEEPYPEGGLTAWLSLLASFCGMICFAGILNSLGTFQSYIIRNQLSQHSAADVGWIFGIHVFVAYVGGIVVGPIFDARGPRILMAVGSACMLASIFLLGICTEYYHFILVFSILGGAGASCVGIPALGSITHFFKRRRGLAMSIAYCGGSIGGVVFPIILSILFTSVGFRLATQALGMTLIPLFLIANIFISSRIPLQPFPIAGLIPDFTVFKDSTFNIVTAALCLVEWSLYISLAYLASFAVFNGMDERLSYQLLSLLNGGSLFGRLTSGLIADKIGMFNAMILVALMCLLTTIGLWLPSAIVSGAEASKWLSIVFALSYGFSSGGIISLAPPVVGELCETEDFGRYVSMSFTVVGFGTLVGMPLGGEMLSLDNGRYEGLIIFSGGCYAVGLGLFVLARQKRVGGQGGFC